MPISAKKPLRGIERPHLLFPILFIFLLLTALFTIFHSHPTLLYNSSIFDAPNAAHPAKQNSTKCPHLVLFSSARHGSTWFIDSVERCRYSASSSKTPGQLFASTVFKHTEPWKHKNSALYRMTPSDVATYVINNSSVKIFSSTLHYNRPAVEQLAREGAKRGIPFVVLRREPKATFRSLRVAKETGVWNGVGTKHVGNVTQMDKFTKYNQTMERYFATVDHILRQAGVLDVDVLDYDKIKNLRYITLERSGCYLRNCNFAER